MKHDQSCGSFLVPQFYPILANFLLICIACCVSQTSEMLVIVAVLPDTKHDSLVRSAGRCSQSICSRDLEKDKHQSSSPEVVMSKVWPNKNKGQRQTVGNVCGTCKHQVSNISEFPRFLGVSCSPALPKLQRPHLPRGAALCDTLNEQLILKNGNLCKMAGSKKKAVNSS